MSMLVKQCPLSLICKQGNLREISLKKLQEKLQKRLPEKLQAKQL